jgi:hypothetical protein
MTSVVELIGGIYRYLPNTLTTTLMILGIMLGKVSWIVISLGAVVLTIFTSLVQYMVSKSLGWGTIPGEGLVSACSILPSFGTSIETIPSLWITLATFYMTFIIKNAVSVYTTKPKKAPNEAISVQHRKSVGVISILTTVLLLAFLIVPRFMTKCESTLGALLGGLLGIGFGIGWWYLLNACGADVYPDIHGVMIGLRPGFKN